MTNVQTSCGDSESYCRAQRCRSSICRTGSRCARGSISLPNDYWGWYGWGWYGFLWDDWFEGAEVVQVEGDALAFRRWQPQYDANNAYVDANTLLYVVDLSNPDAPSIASVAIQPDRDRVVGQHAVVGDTLYTIALRVGRAPGNNGGGSSSTTSTASI